MFMKSEKLAVLALNELLRELVNVSVRHHFEDERTLTKKLDTN